MKKILVLFVLIISLLPVFSQEKHNIEMIHSNSVKVLPDYPTYKMCVGQVAVQHDSTTMYCDSALINFEAKTVDAFGNIEIQRLHDWDTIYLYGDTLHYNGKDKIAKIRQNIVLKQDTTELTTNFLDYDMANRVGTYHNGGQIISGTDTLISDIGYFYSDSKDAFFKDNVQVYSKQANIFTDTLKHNVDNRISYILGPSEIITKDSAHLFAEFGRYDYNEEKAYISHKSKIINKEHSIEADSLFYNKEESYILGFGNVEIIDTVQRLILKGNYGEFHEKAQYSMMTDSALFMDISENDTLWMHSDTLLSYVDTLYDEADTLAFRTVYAYNHVKLFKSDLQLKCDSLVYNQLDSVLMLFRNPVIWSELSQLNSMYIELFMSNNEPKEMFLVDSSFISQKVDSAKFNIVKGQYVHIWFKNKILDRANVRGNVQTLYFIEDDTDSSDIGIARLTCDSMNIFLDSNKIQLLVPFNKPKGVIYPPDKIPSGEDKINEFVWLEEYRPKDKYDIFVWRETESELDAENSNDETENNEENKGEL